MEDRQADAWAATLEHVAAALRARRPLTRDDVSGLHRAAAAIAAAHFEPAIRPTQEGYDHPEA